MDIQLIKQGQLFQRKLGEQSLIAGLVFFDVFNPKEPNSYLSIFNNNCAFICDEIVSDIIPEGYNYSTVQYLLKDKIWNRVNEDQTGIVRFIPVFPEQNGYIMYGACSHSFFDLQEDEGWASINNGIYKEIPSKMKTVGEALSGILRSPIWPDLNDEIFALFDGTTKSNKTTHEINNLKVKVHRNEISESEYKTIIKESHEYNNYGFSIDTDYFEFLSNLEEAGLLIEAKPMSNKDYNDRQVFVNEMNNGILL
jgi:hypothetical protein